MSLRPPMAREAISSLNMDHVAIMKKSWGLTGKILSGQKTIESRWYKNKSKPWNCIRVGETVYFKNSGEPVTLKATIKKVIQRPNLTPEKVKQLLERYGKEDGITKEELPKYTKMFRDKKYCMLISLKNPVTISPFNIDKRGFGVMSAWITVKNIKQIIKPN